MKCRKLGKERNVENGTSDTLISPGKEREHKIDDNIHNENKFPDGYNSTKAQPFMLPKDPLEYYGPWICNTCDGEVDGFTIYSLVRELQAEVETIKGKSNYFAGCF